MHRNEKDERTEMSHFNPAVRDEKDESSLELVRSSRPSTPRELHYFLLLTRDQQVEAIRRLHALGMSDHTIASATRLSVEMIRRLLAEVTNA